MRRLVVPLLLGALLMGGWGGTDVSNAAEGKHLSAAPDLDTTALGAYVRRHVAWEGWPGAAVAVVRDGRVAYATGVGPGQDGSPITADTPFMISSLSKAVTGLLVMRLVEDGRLALDDRVTQYLPDLTIGVTRRQRQAARTITVRHLLYHRSGLGVSTSFVDPPERRPGCAPCLGHVPLSTAPGTAFAYTNLNYALLGRVVEAATGTSYATALADEVAAPLQMRALYARRAAAERHGLAPPHHFLFGVPVRSRGLALDTAATPAGLLAASARDLGRMLAMIQADGVAGDRRVLRPSSVDTLLAPWPRTPTGYAMGWGVGFWQGERIYRHGGLLGGYSAFMAMVPGRNTGVVVLANVNSGVAFPARNRLAYGLLERATGNDPGPIFPLERTARLLALLLALAAVGRLGIHAWQWVREGRPMQAVWTWARGGRVALQLLAPLLFVVLPTAYYGVSPAMLVVFQPDLGSVALIVSAVLLIDAPFVLWTGAARAWKEEPDVGNRATDDDSAARREL